MIAASPYQQLWRVIDGAVTDCFKNHPNYLSKSGQKYAQGSLVKRVTGTVLSFAVQQTARGRVAPAETGQGEPHTSAPEAVGVHASTALHSYAHVNEAAYQAIRRALFPVRRTRAIRRDAGSYKVALAETTAALRSSIPSVPRDKRKGGEQ